MKTPSSIHSSWLQAPGLSSGAWAAFILATLALVSSSPVRIEARPGPRSYRFDGFRLGDPYAGLLARAPYNRPCDDDPVDERKRRAMVYGALPCRGQTFPEQTTVVIFLKMNPPGAPFTAQPVEALVWLHGSYFRKRSDFPVHPGDRLDLGRRKLGKATGQMALKDRRLPALTVWRFPGDVHLLAQGELIRGVAIGPMPRDPANEQWRVVLQMLRRYTPALGATP
ncbi:MAG: hypothetical protein RBU30_24555 [Polyangia bacterium]|jgi:hypothetical protein|nr:hypothetical protein [Polyangia bacterium]